MRMTGRSVVAMLVALSLAPAAPAVAQDFEPPQDWDPQLRQDQMMESLAEVARAFGPHAVILQTALLNEAVSHGSLLEAKVAAPAYQQRDGKDYVAFVLDSGIVYNDDSVAAHERALRTWRELVAPALRRVTELQFPKRLDGVAVSVGYHHRPYADERQLRAELPEKRGEAETTSYFIPLEDAVRLARGTADADMVLPRVITVRNGEVVDLRPL
jgi:hypothetical protein